MIKLIIFDWDDVFTLGSTKGYFKCYHETLLELGVELDPEEEKKRIFKKWGKTAEEELRELLNEKPELLPNAVKIYDKKLFGDTFISCLSPVEGGIKLLDRLKNKYALCVATGMHSGILKEKVIPRFGFPDVFSQIISAYDIVDPKNQKPSPYVINQILERQNVSPDEAVFVGDAKNDVIMAKAAGVTPIVVLTGHLSREEAEELNVEHIIGNVTQIEDVLTTLHK